MRILLTILCVTVVSIVGISLLMRLWGYRQEVGYRQEQAVLAPAPVYPVEAAKLWNNKANIENLGASEGWTLNRVTVEGHQTYFVWHAMGNRGMAVVVNGPP